MKIGMNMLLWTTSVEEEHFPLFAALREAGVDGIEIPVGDVSDDADRAVRRAAADQGLECTAVVALDEERNPASADPKVRQAAIDRLRWAVDKATLLEAKILCGPFHSAYKLFTEEPPTGDELSYSAEVLRAAGEHAGAAGVTLAVEQLNRFECYLTNTAAQTAELCTTVDHPAVGMLYDTHHAHIEEKDPAAAIAAHAGHIVHVHASENDRGTPGSGQVRWVESLGALKKAGYDGWLVIESFSRLDAAFAGMIHIWRDFEPRLEEVYEKGIPFLRETWASA